MENDMDASPPKQKQTDNSSYFCSKNIVKVSEYVRNAFSNAQYWLNTHSFSSVVIQRDEKNINS